MTLFNPISTNSISERKIYKGKIINCIKKQFDIFRYGGIKLELIEALHSLTNEEKRKLGICRIQIINSKVYCEHYVSPLYPATSKLMCNVILQSIIRIIKNYKINNVDFTFFTIDNIPTLGAGDNIVKDFPAFMGSKDTCNLLEQNKILIPDPFILDSIKWTKLINQINAASEINLWQNKKEQIFWRGATTGGTYNLENYHTLPRLTLTMLSKSFPDLIDAKFMHYSQFSNDKSGIYLYNILIRMFDNTEKIAEGDHLKYKYLISIDGNTAAWMRVPWILLSNSILLKQETSFVQLFSKVLEPYVHYVPIKKDLSNIFEKLEWLKANDVEAKVISKNSTTFAMEALMPKDLDEYTAIALNEYHSLQRFEITTPSLAPFITL